MKKCLILLIFLAGSFVSFGAHIKGGWIYYEYVGAGTANPSNLMYKITVKVYRDCSPPLANQNDPSINITIFSGTSSSILTTIPAPLIRTYTLQKGPNTNPCLQNPPAVCYSILEYETTTEVAPSAQGYTLSFQRCCRINGIVNIAGSSNQYGNTYSTTLPGTAQNVQFAQNNSPKFSERDTALVCYNTPFTLDYSATDADGDSLSYQLCPALHGGNANTTTGAAPNPSSPPPFALVPYQSPYSALDPFGTGATINTNTGIISGNAPSATGEYVLSVCVDEFRQGVKIGTTRKELHIVVGNCSLAGAALKPSYITCDGFTLSFQNESTSASITNYAWNFGNPASGASNTSSSPTPTHTYTDTGIYTLKLRVLSSGGCSDSTTALVRVFPGFVADFNFTGSCFESPYQFTDKTITAYGVVDTWRWNFGDVSVTNDTAIIKNPSYLYPSPGLRTVDLIVTNSKGCADTISKPVDVRSAPVLTLPFRDTLICSIDTLPLIAQGTGVFTWTPNSNISNPNTANPLVYPKDTTTYVVTLNENGCIKRDSIKVNVLDFITVDAGNDTTLCRTDSITLRPVSHALKYLWSPAAGLSNPNIKFPRASPANTTKYYLTANLGKCQDNDSITIRVSPYPQANAGFDTSICFGDPAQLSGTIVGSSFTWTPTSTLSSASTLTPIARPGGTTSYILSAFDTLGCPKPFRDTVIVKVNPKIQAFAGNDTTVLINQPLQLNATGGTVYTWTPTTGMNDPNIPNPIVILGPSIDSITYIVRVGIAIGCFATDNIKVRVFKTGPEIFVPSAFTPNHDGRNDVLKPILVGMKGLDYFRIFNRWGHMVFSTVEIGKGWDGRISGVEQASGTFVYMAAGTDYLGNKLLRKGTIVLIR